MFFTQTSIHRLPAGISVVGAPLTRGHVHGTDTFPVRARVLTGAERDDFYAKQAAAEPQFAEYQKKTARVIPVIELRRVKV